MRVRLAPGGGGVDLLEDEGAELILVALVERLSILKVLLSVQFVAHLVPNILVG